MKRKEIGSWAWYRKWAPGLELGELRFLPLMLLVDDHALLSPVFAYLGPSALFSDTR